MSSESPASSGSPTPCDLLHPTARQRLPAAELARTHVFAFASGDVGDSFDALLDTSAVDPTDFVAEDFREDVFLEVFVQRCLPVRIGGREHTPRRKLLCRHLGGPPRDREVAQFRQRVLAELVSSPDLRRATETLYELIADFRTQMTTPPLRGAFESTRRRVEILRAVSRIVEHAATAFDGAESALVRVARWGRSARGAEAYRRLVELLDYEGNVAELDVRVRVGVDGSVRSFQTLARRENRSNRFYQTVLGRFWSRLTALLSGHRFSENELLSRMLDEVFGGMDPHVLGLYALSADLEFYLAGLGFRDVAQAGGLAVCLPAFDDARGRSLEEVFNPLLCAEDGGSVPCTIETHRRPTITIVTGPNSGGKTRLMQSLALTQLLGQSGLFVPASSANLPWARGLFVSLIDHPSAGQTEGRLGMELLRIRRLFEHLKLGSLVVLDELCSGTNPTEGEAIFELVLELLPELEPDAFITTHFLEFARRLEQRSLGLAFLQAELDASRKPTFGFLPGVASTSLARETAERLGVTADALRTLICRNNPELQAEPESGPQVALPRVVSLGLDGDD